MARFRHSAIRCRAHPLFRPLSFTSGLLSHSIAQYEFSVCGSFFFVSPPFSLANLSITSNRSARVRSFCRHFEFLKPISSICSNHVAPIVIIFIQCYSPPLDTDRWRHDQRIDRQQLCVSAGATIIRIRFSASAAVLRLINDRFQPSDSVHSHSGQRSHFIGRSSDAHRTGSLDSGETSSTRCPNQQGQQQSGRQSTGRQTRLGSTVKFGQAFDGERVVDHIRQSSACPAARIVFVMLTLFFRLSSSSSFVFHTFHFQVCCNLHSPSISFHPLTLFWLTLPSITFRNLCSVSNRYAAFRSPAQLLLLRHIPFRRYLFIRIHSSCIHYDCLPDFFTSSFPFN